MKLIKILGRRKLNEAVIIVASALLTLAVFFAASANEFRSAKHELDEATENINVSLEAEIELSFEMIRSIRGLFDASNFVSREEFKIFVTGMLYRHNEIQAFEWIPRIPHARRRLYEAKVRQEKFPDFRITQRARQGQIMIPDRRRKEYFPVTYVEPLIGNEAALGFNLGSSRTRLAAMVKARDTGKFVITERITLVQEKESQSGFLAFYAVYKGKPVTVTERRKAVMGFILGVFRAGDLVTKAISRVSASNVEYVNLEVFDESPEGGLQLLYAKFDTESVAPNLYSSYSMSVGGRTWKLVHTAGQEYLDSQTTYLPFLYSLFTAFSGLLFFGYVGSRAKSAEQRIEDEKRMALFFDATVEGLIIHDQEIILDVNEGTSRIIGCEPDKIIGKSILDFIVPGDHNLVMEKVQSKPADAWDTECIAKDGTRIPVEMQAKIADVDGEPVHILAIRDISERKATHRQFQQVANELTQLIDTANAPIFGVDMLGRINEWNRKMAEITGYKSEEVMDCNFVDEFISKEFKDSVRNILDSALAGKETENYELPVYAKAQHRVLILLNATTRRDMGGHITGVIGIGQDITELVAYRSSMEQKVRDRTQELQTIFTLSPDGFVLIGDDHKIVSANPAFLDMTGFNTENIIGLTDVQFSDKIYELQDADAHPAPFVIGVKEISETLYLTRPAKKTVQCTIRFLKDDAGLAHGSVLYFRDITHETEVDKMKSEFLSAAAHELRTPLASILGFSELLLNRDYEEAQRKDVTETIHRQAINLKNLLDELLDLARIEARLGKDFNMQPDSLQGVFEEVCAEFKSLNPDRVIKMKIKEPWRVVAFDRDKMLQVFRNVVSNAYKYSAKDKDIEYSTVVRKLNGALKQGIRIRDHGIGMSPEELARVGERFYRADSAVAYPGTGLGITLVKEILVIHHGEIEIDSKVGEGTTVTIWLPIIHEEMPERKAL